MGSLTTQVITWRDGRLVLLDQRKLPNEIKFVECSTCREVAAAIKKLVVRGAPAIGVTAAYGAVLAAKTCFANASDSWKECVAAELDMLLQARPTAVNLKWVITRMRAVIEAVVAGDPEPVLLQAAQKIHRQDITANRTLGDFGARLIRDNSTVLTHCNAGALATAGYGTALGVIRSAWTNNKITGIYASETRPWFQGARLTAWELLEDDIPVTLICDGAAASLMRRKKLSWVIVGADCIAANGDVANKIGTYSLAVAAQRHGVNFMVAAPTNTIDTGIKNGDEIEIEERADSEVARYLGHSLAPEGAAVWNPVFDITPASLVSALVTEKGVIEHPTQSKIESLIQT